MKSLSLIVDKLGKTINKSAEKSPDKTLSILKAAYTASGLQMKYVPEKALLPHQRFAAEACNRAIVKPLKNPDSSALVNIYLPCELLHAANIHPLFAEGISCYLNGIKGEQAFLNIAEKQGIPKTYCSFHKTMLGSALSGVLPKPNFIVNTTFLCDANNLSFKTLARFWDIPQFTIDVPLGYSKENLEYLSGQFKSLADFIGNFLGKKIHPDDLSEVLLREYRSISMYNEYFEYLPERFMPTTLTMEMYKLFLTHVLLGTKDAEKYFRLLLEDIKAASKSNGEIRILWGQIMPYWQESLKVMFNGNRRYQVLGSNMSFDCLVKPVIEKPYETFAKRLLLNAFADTAENRISKMIDTSLTLKADGVIYFNHWGCKQIAGTSQLAKGVFEKAGIPLLVLDGDGCDRTNINDGQMVTKLQAFTEILESAKC